ncbi:hypothetical protein M0813_11869 [Anaeramoeba flamelloides]|uniref:Uncharacterized protein n=1 Tax=Anaeramoeba flamelloides TaxID=1746091 RepID=A0ABQ8ZD66_9EUKA|nr:hypothetical protein M0813_11869 [Anaeramoeba flamelloides]
MSESTDLETCTRRVSQIYIGPFVLIMFFTLYLFQLAIKRIKRKSKLGLFDIVTILFFLGVLLRFLYHLVRLITQEEYKTIFLAYLSGTVMIMCVCYLTYFSITMSNYVWINLKDFTGDKSNWALSQRTFKIIFFCFNIGFFAVCLWVGIQLTSGLSNEEKINQVEQQGIIANAIMILAGIFWCSIGIHYYRKFSKILKDLNNKTENIFTMMKISKIFQYSSMLLIVFLVISIICAALGVILDSDGLRCAQFFGVESSLLLIIFYGYLLYLTYKTKNQGKKEEKEKEKDIELK